MTKVTFSAVGLAEYEAALARILVSSLQLARRFDAEVRHALDFLGMFPEAYAFCDEHYRLCPLKRFPYGLIYFVDDNGVRVVAVPHDRQIPGYWAGRA